MCCIFLIVILVKWFMSGDSFNSSDVYYMKLIIISNIDSDISMKDILSGISLLDCLSGSDN